MPITFHGNIKLSGPETAGRPIHIWDTNPQELCPEDTLQSVKSYDDDLTTYKCEPIKSCSVGPQDEFILSPKEMRECVISCDVDPRKIKSKTRANKKIRPLITDSLLHKSDAFHRHLFSTSCYYSLFMVKVILILLFQGTASEIQSLRYYHTGVLQQDDCPFKFAAMGFVNDQQIDKYDHETKRDVPVAPWMGNYRDNNYWDRETGYRQGWEKVFKDNLRILRPRLNVSSTFLTLQLMYGCARNEDGHVIGHYQYALNGRDFLHLEDKPLLWRANMNEAQISADRWNTDPTIAKSVKDYLTKQCIKALEKYIRLGEQELIKKVRPEVKVWGRTLSNGKTRLQCLVYGFHPRDVDVKWMKNGVDHNHSYEMTPILPHPDGTYQMRASVEVPTTEEDAYSCYVDHSSLEETRTVKHESNKYNRRVHAILLSVSLTSVITTIVLLKLVKAKWTLKC